MFLRAGEQTFLRLCINPITKHLQTCNNSVGAKSLRNGFRAECNLLSCYQDSRYTPAKTPARKITFPVPTLGRNAQSKLQRQSDRPVSLTATEPRKHSELFSDGNSKSLQYEKYLQEKYGKTGFFFQGQVWQNPSPPTLYITEARGALQLERAVSEVEGPVMSTCLFLFLLRPLRNFLLCSSASFPYTPPLPTPFCPSVVLPQHLT